MVSSLESTPAAVWMLLNRNARSSSVLFRIYKATLGQKRKPSPPVCHHRLLQVVIQILLFPGNCYEEITDEWGSIYLERKRGINQDWPIAQKALKPTQKSGILHSVSDVWGWGGEPGVITTVCERGRGGARPSWHLDSGSPNAHLGCFDNVHRGLRSEMQ